jgi:hypothetical protein
MTHWLRQHSATLGLLAVVAGATLAGIGLGFILILIGNLIRIW